MLGTVCAEELGAGTPHPYSRCLEVVFTAAQFVPTLVTAISDAVYDV
jgi:hypothetical protein